MNIFKRLKNIWKISEYAEVSHNKFGQAELTIHGKQEEKPRLAQIIKMSSPVEEFLKENI